MATTAQRDRQITAAKRRVEQAQGKLAKAEAEVRELQATIKTQGERIAWLEDMPVDDAPVDETAVQGSGEMTRALDSVDGGGSSDPADEDGAE